jgi:alcohol dehydrogenase
VRAVVYRAFSTPPAIEHVADPEPPDGGVVLKVMASGVCLSDWHGWQGHDPDIVLPHVPGHELAGIVEAVGKGVGKWRPGDRVTLPFVGGCGHCPQCESGNQQVCDYQFQPGFTHWGSFAEYVAVHYADENLVHLPGEMAFSTAASLGCRFATSFRAVVDQGRVTEGESVAVYGCGGVGLSAIMIASALGARVVVVDISDDKLEFAQEIGAVAGVNANAVKDVAGTVRELTDGGAHVSLDAIGNARVCFDSIDSLRKRGRHVQIGLVTGDQRTPRIPMHKVIANELEIRGSHGMQAWRYEQMLAMIEAGELAPEKLIGHTIDLEESIAALMSMGDFDTMGVTIIDRF